MDKVIRYRSLIERILSERAELSNRSPSDGAETVCAFDEARDQYLLMNVGWVGDRRVRGTNLFLRIRNSKIWIEEDWTEEGIATLLLEAGVPKDDIVLAFHHPKERQYTEFAVA